MDEKRKRVLFIGDTHIDNRPIPTRRDDYLEAGLAELQECLQIARDRECYAVVHLGDVFHRMEPNGECRNAVMRLFQHDENHRAWPFRKYVVVGNHDIHSSDANLPHSALGTLIRAGVVWQAEADPELGIVFGHFYADIDNDVAAGKLKERDCTIWAGHASITTGPIFGSYVLLEDVQTPPSCRLIVTGHVHTAMRATRDDGVEFIDPGSVCRNTLNQENLERVPQVLLVEYDLAGGKIDTELIPLQSSASAKDIFRIEEVQAKKDEIADYKRYMQQISRVSFKVTALGVIEGLRQSARFKKISPEVEEVAVQALENARQRKG